MSFKGPKPSTQPRTLRTIAETNDPKHLLAPAPPEPEPSYKDSVEVVKFSDRRDNAAGKSPFGRMR